MVIRVEIDELATEIYDVVFCLFGNFTPTPLFL